MAFISEIQPECIDEALQHQGWIDAMQEDLNQFEKTRFGLWFLCLKDILSLAQDGYSETSLMKVER